MAANIDFSTAFNFIKCLLQKITLRYLVIRHPLEHRCQEIWAFLLDLKLVLEDISLVLEYLEVVLELPIRFLKHIVAIIVLEWTIEQDYAYDRHNHCSQSCSQNCEPALTRYHFERGLPFDCLHGYFPTLVDLSFFATPLFQHLCLNEGMGSAFLCGILDLQSAPAVFSYGR